MTSPVFIISLIRSGSTLLRLILNSHSAIYAPHEGHLHRIKVVADWEPALANAMHLHGLDNRRLKYLLRDRLYDFLLERSGKRIFVDKDPSNVSVWRDLAEFWPEAVFIFLVRNPAYVAYSAHKTYPGAWPSLDIAVRGVVSRAALMDEALKKIPNSTLFTYEGLVKAPEIALKRLCGFIGVDYEPSMLKYDTRDLHPLDMHVGDYGEKICSGAIQPDSGDSVDVMKYPALRQACEKWGYA